MFLLINFHVRCSQTDTTSVAPRLIPRVQIKFRNLMKKQTEPSIQIRAYLYKAFRLQTIELKDWNNGHHVVRLTAMSYRLESTLGIRPQYIAMHWAMYYLNEGILYCYYSRLDTPRLNRWGIGELSWLVGPVWWVYGTYLHTSCIWIGR